MTAGLGLGGKSTDLVVCKGVHLCYPALRNGCKWIRVSGTCLLHREFKGTLGYMSVYLKENGRCQNFLWAPVRLAYLISHTVAIQCLETAFGVTLEDSDLALPQTLPEIFEAATASKVSPASLDCGHDDNVRGCLDLTRSPAILC